MQGPENEIIEPDISEQKNLVSHPTRVSGYQLIETVQSAKWIISIWKS